MTDATDPYGVLNGGTYPHAPRTLSDSPTPLEDRMTIMSNSRQLLRRLTTVALGATTLFSAACAETESPLRPELPGAGTTSSLRPVAFTADINVRTGEVKITAPTTNTRGQTSLGLGGKDGVAYSLLGGEAVRLIASNPQFSAVGAFQPGRVRATFDIVIENKLPGIRFITPTWPTAPAAGVILFPLEQVVTSTPGGVTGTDGFDVIVELPSFGLVTPSIDWNGTNEVGSGSPFNFFNDADCGAITTNDCFRWEAFDLELLPAPASSIVRTVGFDLDPTVGQFRARMIVAADLAPAGVILPATISGTVTSAVRGPLDGVTVNVSGGGSDDTDATGAYSVTGIGSGSRTVSLSNLPAGCTTPASQVIAAAPGVTYTANFAVTCSGLPGQISGIVTRSYDSAPIAGATVTAGGVSATTSATGAYTLANVPAGAGSLVITGTPATCSAFSAAYTLLSGASLTQDATVSCTVPPPPAYTYNTTWTNLGGGQVAVDLRINMLTLNNPAIDDVTTSGSTGDPLTGAQITVTFDNSRLEFVEGLGTSAPNITAAPTVNGSTPGVVAIVNATTTLRTGNVGIARIVFNVRSGATGSVGTTTTFQGIASRSGGVTVVITPNVQNAEGTFILP